MSSYPWLAEYLGSVATLGSVLVYIAVVGVIVTSLINATRDYAMTLKAETQRVKAERSPARVARRRSRRKRVSEVQPARDNLTPAPLRLLKNRIRGRSLLRMLRRSHRRNVARGIAARKGLETPYTFQDDTDLFEEWPLPAGGVLLAPKGLRAKGDRLAAAFHTRKTFRAVATDGHSLRVPPDLAQWGVTDEEYSSVLRAVLKLRDRIE